MFQVTLLWLITAVCLADPQGHQYSTPGRNFQGNSFNQASRGHFSDDSDERISRFNSGERFSDLDSREGFSGGSSSNFGSRGSGSNFGQNHFSGSGSGLGHNRFGSSRSSFRQAQSSGSGSGLGQSNFGSSGSSFGQAQSSGSGSGLGQSHFGSSGSSFGQAQSSGFGSGLGQSQFGSSGGGLGQTHSRSSGLGLGQSHFGSSRSGFRQTHSGSLGERSSEEYTGQISTRTNVGVGSGRRHSGFKNAFSRNDGFDFSSGPAIAILRDDREDPVGGAYSFVFESADGISRQESGSPNGNNGAVVQQGSWSFTYPDGTPALFNFIADEGGFQVESDLLPKGPPIPAHALEQIEKAERERAAGIIHDGQYREEDHFGSSLSHGGQSSFRGSSGSFRGSQSSFGGAGGLRRHSSFEDDSDETFPGAHSSFGGSSGNLRGLHSSSRDSRESLESSGGIRSNFGSSGRQSFQRGNQQAFGGSFRSSGGNQGFGSLSQGIGSSRRFQSSNKSYGN